MPSLSAEPEALILDDWEAKDAGPAPGGRSGGLVPEPVHARGLHGDGRDLDISREFVGQGQNPA
jgi:hypothetical protein